MSPDLWLAFAAASILMLMIPGPTVLIVVSYALGHGRRSAMATVAGVALGDFTAMTASMLGLGVLLSTSAMLFTGLKWLGAAYLVWLGLKLWRAPVTPGEVEAEQAAVRPWRMMLHTYAVTALNPKSIVFFVAFLPQFLDAGRPLFDQMLVMEATFLVLATLNAAGYALLASAARRAVRAPAVQRTVNRVGGSLLMGAGLLTVAWKRTV
ncbi:LysE family translocator [Azospirillum picis]|uniref:Threonine/homoserine/homoserine lactone efflux protein n=1 Tax=Azospirillum picis TaxID=488438 RepID=A0ABU0MD84_9PROT|nr:LysE family translocator [Azospirillum picis]MBP2297574.1 threonine/homoserine/homoserine lactone efflux protein [Azospirillum picis]MDQ0531403.1 threonine/homoserine/homoserine lactone efflux protein [Azospirillum picis]